MSALTVDFAAVDFDLSADQEALGEAAAALLDRPVWGERLRRRVGPGTVVGTLLGSGTDGAQGAGEGAAVGYDEELWAAMADQGWLAVEEPEASGGLGLGMVEVAVLCEALGRRLAPVPFLTTVLALGALRASGSTDDRVAEWAAALSSGDAVGCVAWSVRRDAVTVEGAGGEVRLSGRPDPTLFAPSATVAVVASVDGVFAVGLDESARPAPEPAMDRTRELGRLAFDRTPAVRLDGPAASTALLDRAATGVAAELLGGASRVLEMSVDYAKDRVQFGRPIGSFQAVKHRLADALVDVEGMRSTAYYAAWCAAVGDRDASLAASMAKSWCSDAAHRVMASGLQVHGGIGFTWEHDLHLYLKRSQLDQVRFGDGAWHRDRIATLLRLRLESGEGIL